jgi:hypothetical protein
MPSSMQVSPGEDPTCQHHQKYFRKVLKDSLDKWSMSWPHYQTTTSEFCGTTTIHVSPITTEERLGNFVAAAIQLW